jgi:hypothetical protein
MRSFINCALPEILHYSDRTNKNGLVGRVAHIGEMRNACGLLEIVT